MSLASAFLQGKQIKNQREALRLQKQARDQELKMAGYDPETMEVIPGSNADVQKMQNEQTLQLAKSLQNKLAAQDTDRAILDFSETGDATYLQNALDNNQTLKDAWAKRGVLQLANIDWQNDEKLLKQKGFNEAEYDTPEKQAILRKNIYKFYDGSKWNIGLLNNAVAETGVMKRVGKHRGQQLIDNYQSFRDFMAGPRSSAHTAEGHKYENKIREAAESTKVPANLISSVLSTEKNYSPEEIPEKSKLLGDMLTKYNGDTRLALAAYYSGGDAVDKANGIPKVEGVQEFVNNTINNFSAAESYYDTNANIEENKLNTGPTPNPISLEELNSRQAKYADNRIATIQEFIRSNANAAKGTTSENVDAELADKQLNTKISAAELVDKQTNTQIRAGELASKNQANAIKLATDGMTTTQKDLRAAELQTEDLLNKFGGEDQFFNTDFSKQDNFNMAWPNVVKINKLEGTELTQKDRDNITDMRSLMALADPAIRLSASQTGLLDKPLSNVKKYMSDNVSGVEQASAIASFRNTLRHALFGSALTEAEIEAFNEAFGQNKQKLGPVLKQFKVALGQIQAKLDSISQLGNPYTMKVLLGSDIEKMNKIKNALQQRIDYIDGRISNNSKNTTQPTQSLEDIWGGE